MWNDGVELFFAWLLAGVTLGIIGGLLHLYIMDY